MQGRCFHRESERLIVRSPINPFLAPFLDGFAIFDFETTGLSPFTGDRALQVAVVRLDPLGEFEDEWVSLVNPGRPVAATEVHGLTEDDVREAPAFSAVWVNLESRFSNRIVVAHNASFDLKFLAMELRLINRWESVQPFFVFDTLRLAHLVEGATNRRQRSLASVLGIDPLEKPGRGPHDALTDSHVAADILRHYLTNWPDQVVEGIREFPRDFDALTSA